jgi:hypothetical protein
MTPPTLPRSHPRPRYRLLFALLLLGPALFASEPDPPEEGPAFLVHPYLQLPTPTAMTVMWETSVKLPGKVSYGLTRDLSQSVEVKEPAVLHEVRLTGLRPDTAYFYRVQSGPLVSGVYRFQTAPPPGTKHWRMAVYGDSRSNPATHRKVAEQIARAGVDLIVHTGDIVLNGRNHASWRREFFEPLGPLAHRVPWVSTIGNHERDSENYFSYMALPGNERYFGFDYANAHIVCLDSNAWIEKGRDSQQFQWVAEHLRQKRTADWTFVAFHHPLFSAHATRPINSLRWDWAPLILDPANRVDGVLTGHDHFYARNFRVGRLADAPQPGVLFLTTAGGGASLYRIKERDYVAREKSVHHFTLFDFNGDRVTITPIDLTGKEFDRYVLTKEPTSAEEFAAFEVEELRQFLRLALASATPVQASDRGTTIIDTSLRVPTRFAVPVSGQLLWEQVPGWKLKQEKVPFLLKPWQPLVIPLQAEVAAGTFGRSPKLIIVFEPGKFRNRTIEVSPFQLAGPSRVAAVRTRQAITFDGSWNEKAWEADPGHALLALPPTGGRGDQVRLLMDDNWLYLGARLDDPAGKVEVKGGKAVREGSRLVLSEEHVRLVLSDGERKLMFAVSPSGSRYTDGDTPGDDFGPGWKAALGRSRGAWYVEMAVPRVLFAGWSEVRLNVAHRRQEGKDGVEMQLCPSYSLGKDADRIPDFQPSERAERFARLVTE